MTNIGLPVPAGFTISIDACVDYYRQGRKLPKGLDKEVLVHMKRLEKVTGKRFGDPEDPLLVSVRSGAARSMPGMMETILNLGLTDVSVEGLAKKTGNARFAYDAYRRFIQMYSTTAMASPRSPWRRCSSTSSSRRATRTTPRSPPRSGRASVASSRTSTGRTRAPTSPRTSRSSSGLHRRRLQLLGGGEVRHLPARREDHRHRRDGGQHRPDGLRQQG